MPASLRCSLYSLRIKRKYWISLFFFVLSVFVDYQYGFLFGVFYLVLAITSDFSSSSQWRQRAIDCFPPPFQGLIAPQKIYLYLFCCVGFLPFLSILIRKQFLFYRFPLVADGGSNPLVRMGLIQYRQLWPAGFGSTDTFNNGGFLGSLQFLAGTPLSNLVDFCEIPVSFDFSYSSAYCLFRAVLVMLGMIVLSIIAIYGFYLFSKVSSVSSNSKSSKWIYVPLLFAFSALLFVFQQSFSIHAFGHSYVWGFLFSFGVVFVLIHYFQNSTSILLRSIIALGYLPVFLNVLASTHIARAAIFSTS